MSLRLILDYIEFITPTHHRVLFSAVVTEDVDVLTMEDQVAFVVITSKSKDFNPTIIGI